MAEQLEFFPLANPCKGICEVNERGYCRGCLRNREERFAWNSFSDGEKREILRLCRQRQLRQQRAPAVVTQDEPQQPRLF